MGAHEPAADAGAPPAPAAPSTPGDTTPESALPPRPRASSAQVVVAVLACIAVAWFGQRFLIPVVAGVLLALLLGPLVLHGEKALRSRTAGTVLALVLAMTVLGWGTAAFSGQLLRVAERVPEMLSLAAHRMEVTQPRAQSLLSRARQALQELDRAAGQLAELEPPPPPRRKKAAAAAAQPPAEAASAAPFTDSAAVALRETAISGSGMLFKFLGDLTIVFFVALFMLAGGPALAERFLDLWGHAPGARMRAARTLSECARQVRWYAVVLLLTNTVIGLGTWAAFAAGGLPDAAGWGIAAGVLHLIPYLGMALLTALGAAETFLAHGTVAATAGMVAYLVGLSTLVGTLVMAWLQGRAARMSPAAVFIGLVFWGALWGVWGLFLGPVLIVITKVVAEHSRTAQPLARLMAE